MNFPFCPQMIIAKVINLNDDLMKAPVILGGQQTRHSLYTEERKISARYCRVCKRI